MRTYTQKQYFKLGLESLRKKMGQPRFKVAAIGGEPDQGFEQAFATLAFTYLKDKAPKLIPYLVGFQLVERNEDNTKALGVFGIKADKQWLYSPVFFLNGDLKGTELLIVKKPGIFVPLKEKWVNYLLSQKPYRLGERSEEDAYQMGGLTPNLTRLTYPPLTGGKISSVSPSLEGFYKLLDDVKSGKPFDKQASIRSAVDLNDYLSSSFELTRRAWKAAEAFPIIKEGFDKFYGKDFFLNLGRHHKLQLEAAENSLVTAHKMRKQADSQYLIPPKEHPIKSGALRIHIFTMRTVARGMPYSSDEDKEKLLRGNILVDDRRTEDQVSKAYKVETNIRLFSPDKTNLYEVLQRDGSFERMLVLLHPVTGEGRSTFATVVKLDPPRNWLNIHPTFVWAKDSTSRDAFRSWWDGLAGVDSIAEGGVYVAVGKNGEATAPFKVKHEWGGSYRVAWAVSAYGDDAQRTKNPRPSGLSSRGNYKVTPNVVTDIDRRIMIEESGYRADNATIWINEKKGSRLKSLHGEVGIPADFKVVKLNYDPIPGYGCLCSSPSSLHGRDDSSSSPILLGDFNDLMNDMDKSANFRVAGRDNSVVIVSPSGRQLLNKEAAFVSLIRDHGLSESATNEILDNVKDRQETKYIIKYAQGFGGSLQPGPSAPAFPEALRGSEALGYKQQPSIYPQTEFLPVPGTEAARTDPSTYDQFLNYEHSLSPVQRAQEAANRGDKEVFDVSMLTHLLKSMANPESINREIGNLLKAMDSLGKLLFGYYYHQDQWQDRYGKDDMPEIEDSLRNAFEDLGEVILYLKERDIRTPFDDLEEPNIEDIAEKV